MNPNTELHSVKGLTQATDEHAALRAKLRAETYALLTDGDHDSGTLEDRFDR